MDENNETQQPRPVQINTNDELSRGRYSNLILVSNSPDEFILDWLLNSPNGVHLVSRIITSPANMKRTINTLTLSLQQYEKKFGVIKPESEEQNMHH
jgi:hypothetical protein